jgi:hypothetical protein
MSRNTEGWESGERGQAKEQPHQRPSYLDARRYPSAEAAGKAYLESQEAIRRGARKADLSVYRVLLGPLVQPHVIVLGDTPHQQLLAALQRALGADEHVDLAAEMLEQLTGRRAEAEKLGRWVEGHYTPGIPMRLPKRR